MNAPERRIDALAHIKNTDQRGPSEPLSMPEQDLSWPRLNPLKIYRNFFDFSIYYLKKLRGT